MTLPHSTSFCYNHRDMKKDLHPKYNHNVKVICSCGNTFITGSTTDSDIVTDLCSKCHPFYTGEQKIVDSDNLVAKFEEKKSKASSSFRSKREKMAQRKEKLQHIQNSSQLNGKELTLKDMLDSIGK